MASWVTQKTRGQTNTLPIDAYTTRVWGTMMEIEKTSHKK